jgi:hypothetical protein
MVSATYGHSEETVIEVKGPARTLFDYLDDQTRLGEHMEKPSMMMMGGSMSYGFDDAKGRAVGSVIRMGGNVLGLKLSVEEVVVERIPPLRKSWETLGHPHLLVIGSYRMGFEIAPAGVQNRLRVFINYNHPRALLGQVLGFFFARMYARWCISRMADAAISVARPMIPLP